MVYKGEEREVMGGEEGRGSLPLPTIILLASLLTGLALAIGMGLGVRYKGNH